MTGGPAYLRRLAGAFVLMLQLLLFPLLVGFVLGGRYPAIGAVLGSFIAFLMSLAVGWRTASLVLPFGIAVAAVTSAVGLGGAWALLLALVGAATGWAGRYGLFPAVALIGVMASVAPAPGSGSDLAAVVVLASLGAVNGVLLTRRLGIPSDRRDGDRWSRGRAASRALLLAAAAGAAALIAADWSSGFAYWLPMTVFLIAVPTAGVSIGQKAVARVAGTALGAAVAAALIPLQMPRPAAVAVGVLCLLFSLVHMTPLWLNAALTTLATIALLAVLGTDPARATLDRVEAVAVGSGLLLAGLAVGSVVARLRRPTAQERAVAADYDPAGLNSAGGPAE